MPVLAHHRFRARVARVARAARVLLAVFGTTLGNACSGGGGEPTVHNPGIRNDTIFVGALVPQSDAVALIGKPILAGVEAYFAQVNADKGGVAGRYRLHLMAEDVTYANPSTSVQKYNKIRDQVAMFVPILGTDHVNVSLPLLAEDSLLAVPSTMDAEWVREPSLISVLAPYQIGVINGIDYWITAGDGKGKTLCTLVMSTGYGEAGEEGAQYAAKAAGTTVAVSAKFRPGDQDFVAPITQLKNAGCQGVVLTSLPSETGRILGTAAQLQFAPRWIATGPSWHVVLGESPVANYAKQHLWVSLDGGEWGDTTQAGMREQLRALASHAPAQKPDFYFTAGYIFAHSAVAVLEEAARLGDLSRTGIAKALTTLEVVRHGGLTGDYTYGPIETREPPRVTSILAIDPTKPGGYALVERDHGSETARAFVFEKRR
jgi:ABC-type branched-subunit amino acid transport system substrate-binding protein